jgi:IS5 family transposase
MKAHVGIDRRGIVHSLRTTAANEHDSTQMFKLLHGEDMEYLATKLTGMSRIGRARRL